ncbi:odorant receptor 46a-like isoform X2 [Metopolophium dirhodum]|uniref:odorant receptor 46a-like isoform X2 n=1 Tax=Metopolophium dirhodum TaxID=44670 RepID=UPI00298FC9BB|nr:odorant receptor 46a-like isoform X2 [Metopolophium dirhodum]
MMDIRDDQNLVFNITLAKFTGLYQMLNPQTIRCRGLNVHHFIMAFIVLYVCVIGMILTVSGVYYWTDNMPLSIDYIWKGITCMSMFYPMCVIVHYSNAIWDCLSITCYGFTSHSLRDRHNCIQNHWRERSVLFTTTLTVLYFTSVTMFLVSSLSLSNVILLVKNHDGSVGNYRHNIFNLYLFVSDDTYNAHYTMFYVVEALGVLSFLITLYVFDFLLVTLCLAIRCQMQMVCTAFESVGHKLLSNDLSLVDCRDEKEKSPNKHDLIHDELKTIIMDHQAVMKKYDAFFTIFKRALLLQIVVFSIGFIIVWFCFIMSFSNDERFIISRIFTVKIFSVIPSNLFKIFALCYLFGNLHDQKDSIIFALYSSNWTEMDMKCKKLILLTMKMNNANQKKLKFTRTRIVNLEMFFKYM